MAVETATRERLQEEITTAQYRSASNTFCRLLTGESMTIGQAIHTAISGAAPFLQVPSHVMRLPTGDMRGVNYDHTILGWRGAIALQSCLPDRQAILPTVQAMWYMPQGLNVWEQIICDFPGHYARAENCNTRFPGPDPSVNRFDGPAWTEPRVHMQDVEAITAGTVDERLDELLLAIIEGDRERAYGLFLGLADDEEHRTRLKERILFVGIIDLQETLINHPYYQNIGHKALRARALIDLADFLGWEQAHSVFYTVVPDLACSPRLHGLWNEICNVVRLELPRSSEIPKRALPLSDRELDWLTETLLWAGSSDVNREIVDLYRAGHGILDVCDGVAVGYQQYLMDVLEHPSAFNNPMHSFDYCNVVNTWIRTYESPHQVKGPFMAARFVNDAIRDNAMFPRDPKVALPPRSDFRGWADGIAVDRTLPVLLETILEQDAPRACALVDSYLERTDERGDLLRTITYAALHYQNDPHVMRNCTPSLEEFELNQTPRRDDIIRGFVKHQSRYVKRATTHEAFNLYARYFDDAAIPR